jgi:thiol-disulfide isomerase/thioredoxin
MKEAALNAEFFVPTEPEDPWTGKDLRFETTDLDGNPVRSVELFAQHKVTMLNVWATWCGPCKGELQELGEINRRVQDQDGNPVQGVTVQFCSEAECVLGKTDADGAASFNMPEGPGHEIHLLKVPEGFEKDGTTYSAPETYGDIVLVLNKAA